MCLIKVTDYDPQPPVGEAWKVFFASDAGVLYSEGHNWTAPRAVNIWLSVGRDFIIWTARRRGRQSYKGGFHCFVNKADAERWRAYGGCPRGVGREVVRRVLLRGKQTLGQQCWRQRWAGFKHYHPPMVGSFPSRERFPVVVSNEILILPVLPEDADE